MKKRIFFVIFLTLVLGLSQSVFAQHQHGTAAMTKEQGVSSVKPKTLYRCSMHPQVVSDKPGKCPICGMDLVAFTPSQEMTQEESTESPTVKIDESQQKLIGMQTEAVVSRPLMKMIRTVAKIAYDPQLYKAEQEFIEAFKLRKQLASSQSPDVAEQAQAIISAAELKLKLQGLSDEQIKELTEKTSSDRALLISDGQTPHAWAYAVIYEYDMSSVEVGDPVTLTTIAYPGEEFSGTIKAIDPVLDAATRSVRIRILIDNAEGKLKPNMYGDVLIHIDLGQQLALPSEAVLDTGLRKIVYIDLGKGQFKAQEIKAGSEAIGMSDGQERRFFPVIEGVKENDRVVTSGNFLIDSQSQLTGGMSALWGGATEIKQESGTQEIKTEHRH